MTGKNPEIVRRVISRAPDENTDKQEGVGRRDHRAIAVAACNMNSDTITHTADDCIDRDDRAQLPHVTGLRLGRAPQAQVAQASDKPAGTAVEGCVRPSGPRVLSVREPATTMRAITSRWTQEGQ